MPNHCSQDLWVTGPTNILKEFKEFAKEVESYEDGSCKEILLSANKFIPYPQKFIDIDNHAKIANLESSTHVKDGFNSGGYEWCIENWGTKWGIYDCTIIRENLLKKNGTIMYQFDSAWSPANKIILAMAKQYPLLTFKLKYYECGLAFKGILIVKDSQIIKDSSSKYHGNRGG
jgi:hypothetical protein